MKQKNIASSGAHLGFSEGRDPNFRKGADQYKAKKSYKISHISVTFWQLESTKLGTQIVDKNFFQGDKPN